MYMWVYVSTSEVRRGSYIVHFSLFLHYQTKATSPLRFLWIVLYINRIGVNEPSAMIIRCAYNIYAGGGFCVHA